MPEHWGVVGKVDEWFIWMDLDQKLIWACVYDRAGACTQATHRAEHHVGIQVRYGDGWFSTPLHKATLKVIRWITTKGAKFHEKQTQQINEHIELPKAVRNLIVVSGGKAIGP